MVQKIISKIDQVAVIVWLALFFCAGILFERIFNIPFFLLFFICLLCLSISLIFSKNQKTGIFIYIAFLILGALVLKNKNTLSNNHLINLTPYIKQKVYLQGSIIDDPFCSDRKCSFAFRVTGLIAQGSKFKISADCLVNSYRKEEFKYGQIWILQARPRRSFSYDKNFNYRKYLANRGIHAILNVSSHDNAKLIKQTQGFLPKYFAIKAKHVIKNIFIRNLEPLQADILNTLILGSRQALSKDIRDIFTKTGTAHILSVSGLHLAIVAFIFLIFLKTLRIYKRLRYVVTIIFLIFYCFLTGMNVPVVRSTVMITIILVGLILQRPVKIYNALSLAAIFILLFNPNDLFDISFQLSFASIISIFALSPYIEKKPIINKSLKFIIKPISVSLAAWLGTFAIIIHYFKIFSPITILANLIIVPYMSIVLALGFLLAMSGLVMPFFVPQIAIATNFSLSLLILITQYLSRLPFAYFYL